MYVSFICVYVYSYVYIYIGIVVSIRVYLLRKSCRPHMSDNFCVVTLWKVFLAFAFLYCLKDLNRSKSALNIRKVKIIFFKNRFCLNCQTVLQSLCPSSNLSQLPRATEIQR